MNWIRDKEAVTLLVEDHVPDSGLSFTFNTFNPPSNPVKCRLLCSFIYSKSESAEKLVACPAAPRRDELEGEFEPRSVLLQSLSVSLWALQWVSFPP